MSLSWNEIQDRATEFASKWEGETYEKGESQSYWGDFLNIFGIDRRRHGAFFEYAIKKGSGKQGFIDMFWPSKLLAEQKSGGKDLSKAGIQAYEYLETMPDHDLPEAIILSDFASFVFIKNDGTNEKVEFSLADLPKNVKLFGFLINQKSRVLAEEDPVNRKAAEAMARLHNQLRDDNYTGHDLELLLVRLVFCMFADDSGIFDHSVLFDYLQNQTNDDGSDFGPRLVQIFQALNTPLTSRQSSLDESIASLPYVNGGLFAESIQTPNFNRQMRGDLLQSMELDWSKVSPAIFGSMFQGVMNEKQRRNLGAHYTSEKNILRVIKPLFLDDLYDEFAVALASGPRKKFDELHKLQDKIADLKFLDPACGCGNFLVITYRELRRLEHKIVALLAKNVDQQDMFASAGEGVGSLKVNVDQMYGIEIEEFPSLIAQTALWLTDHQMNMEYSQQSGKMFKRLPLIASATIVHEDALKLDWQTILPYNKEFSYILGNPPFIGSKLMSAEQKSLMTKYIIPRDINGNILPQKSLSTLDFVAGWYMLAALYMVGRKTKTALVSTNSITQGEQVSILWRKLFNYGFSIDFAHTTFKWSNDAKGNAAVYCVIIGFSQYSQGHKILFEYPDIKGEPSERSVTNINAYLLEGADVFVDKHDYALSYPEAPMMQFGNMPLDGGHFLFSAEEKNEFLASEPQAEKYIKPFIGARELINEIPRYCLWLENNMKPVEPVGFQKAYPLTYKIIRKVQEFRDSSSRKQTQERATTPFWFGEMRFFANSPEENIIIIPRHSSENRRYIPIGFFTNDVIPGDSCVAIQKATLYHFGILTSRMHMAWTRAVAGRLKSDYRYSKDIVYNNFIWPEVTEQQKTEISKLAQQILDVRAEFPDASLADLYDPLTMPRELSKAHKTLDRAVDKIYATKPFASDTERVALLFEKYQKYGG